MRYDTVRSRTWTSAPTDVPAKPLLARRNPASPLARSREVDEREVNDMLAHAAWWPGFGLLWIVLFWGVVVLFFRRRRGWWGGPRASGEAVLGERYARVEITEDEYRQRLRVLKNER